MSNAGIGLRIIQEISGHNNLEQLQHYLEVKPDRVKGAIASFSMLSYRGNTLFFPPYHSQINQIEDESWHLKPEELAGRIF